MMRDLKVDYVGLICGKLRRYFSFENIIDFFKVPVSIVQSLFVLMRFKPDVIFCKGGYVCFPVALAGWLLRIPVILHEADVTPGLANRLSVKFAKKICISYEESRKYFPASKVEFTGNIIRKDLAKGNAKIGLDILGFREMHSKRPLVLVMGGSLGAEFINQLIWKNLGQLLKHFSIVHICGAGNVKSLHELESFVNSENHENLKFYRSFEFVKDDLKHFYAAASVVVTRAGAMSLAEIGYFNKPAILIPLPRTASRGDQFLNAEMYIKEHNGVIMEQESFDEIKFLQTLQELAKKNISHRTQPAFAVDKIIQLLKSV